MNLSTYEHSFTSGARPLAGNVLGADGGPRGTWVAVLGPPGREPTRRIAASTEELFALILSRRCRVAVLDIPIGLPACGTRACDQQARRLLGTRASCVFSAPPRPVLAAGSQREASRIWRDLDGRGCPAQTFGILRRIDEVDRRLSPGIPVLEGHPELSFRALASGEGLPSKHLPAGAAIRGRLLAAQGVGAAWRIGESRRRLEDSLDAGALWWTACRVASGAATVLPVGSAECDPRGLAMRIHV